MMRVRFINQSEASSRADGGHRKLSFAVCILGVVNGVLDDDGVCVDLQWRDIISFIAFASHKTIIIFHLSIKLRMVGRGKRTKDLACML